MNEQRLESARKAMAAAGIDALLCRLPENVVMLSGHWPLCGDAVLAFAQEGKPVLLVPDTQAVDAAQDLFGAGIMTYPHGRYDSPDQDSEIQRCLMGLPHRKSWKKIGIEGDFDAFAAPGNAAEPRVPGTRFKHLLENSFSGSEFMDVAGLLDSLRRSKTGWEIEKIRIACEISNIGIEVFFSLTDVGRTAIELAAAVESAVLVRGTGYKKARRVRAFAQVAVGDSETALGWRPFEVTTGRKLLSGELSLLELAVVADGYWSDRTRARVAGHACAEQIAANEAVKAAQDSALSAIHPGVLGCQVDAKARDVLSLAGYGKEFVHITGHGVGFRYHEPYPVFAPESRHTLFAGATATVEPGIYSPAFGGIRVEDDIAVTNDGCEVLAPFSREIG